ncbi:hypothetical protein BKA83DRAFT_4269139 [Pisolithus microcarpus]|nr:hypothetical protein BKA83DRAFT_4269139 [Pisolithus microcarpus]
MACPLSSIYFISLHSQATSVSSEVCTLDTMNTIGLLSFLGRLLIFCRWKTAYACTSEMPWDLSMVLVTSFLVWFFVQCFYSQSLDNWRWERAIDGRSAYRRAGATGWVV